MIARIVIAIAAAATLAASCGSEEPEPSPFLNDVLCNRDDGLLPPGKDCD